MIKNDRYSEVVKCYHLLFQQLRYFTSKCSVICSPAAPQISKRCLTQCWTHGSICGHNFFLWCHGPLARYVKLRVAHATGMPGTFSLPPRVSDPDMHHGTCVTHVSWCMPGSLTSGFLWSRWRRKRSRHSRRMRNQQFYVAGKMSIKMIFDCEVNHDAWRKNGYIEWRFCTELLLRFPPLLTFKKETKNIYSCIVLVYVVHSSYFFSRLRLLQGLRPRDNPARL